MLTSEMNLVYLAVANSAGELMGSNNGSTSVFEPVQDISKVHRWRDMDDLESYCRDQLENQGWYVVEMKVQLTRA